VALLAGATDTASGRWVVLALVLGLVGDALLLQNTPQRFLGGLVAFLLGHLAYVAAFVTAGLDRPALGWLGVLVVVVALVVGRRILPGAVSSGGPRLGGAVAAYMVVIGALAVTGWATGRLLVGLGASLFVVSDTVLAMGRFVQERRWTFVVVMVTYHLAQALIVAGLLLV
jgi:uncharacterized membrane protein YhhN